jgi:hypothetical protein
MPDATSTVKVDGVEPSILVRLLDEPESPLRVKVFTADDGTERFLVKGGEPILVTSKDLSVLGVVPYEIVGASSESVEPAAISSGPKSAPVIPDNPLGPSSPQA